MAEGTSRNTLALIAVVGILVLGIVCIPFVGGGSLIRGMGNGANRIYLGGIGNEVAEAIAASSAVSEVADDDLRAAYLSIRQRALSGEIDAAMVLFRVAEIQRAERRD
jgi:hypothetical protein